MEATLTKPQRREELDYLNAVSCLCVMLIHILSYGILRLDPTSPQLALVYLPWKLAGYVVPAFLFTGAVKMAMAAEKERETSYPSYIRRRVQKIYLPYMLWYLVYYAIYARIGYAPLSASYFVRTLLDGTLSAQFYYVVIVMQFYLLMPLWRWVLKRVPALVGLPLSLLITLAMQKGDTVLAQLGIDFHYCDRVFLSYLFFWMLGLYAGSNWDAVVDCLNRNRRAVFWSGLGVLAFVLMTWLQYARSVFIYDAVDLKPLSDMLTILFLLSLCLWLKEAAMPRLKRLLTAIHRASFDVFLSHCLFLTLADGLLRRAGIERVGINLVVRILVCITLPFITSWALNRFRTRIKGLAR